MIKKITLIVALVCFGTSINAQWWGNKKVKGNGNVTTITRNTGSYDGVSVGGFFDVILVKGKEGKITINGEQNLMEYIFTEVSGNNLRIKVEKGINLKATRRLTVTVPVEKISKVSLGGSGNIISKINLNSENLEVNLGGSGNIDLSLKATSVKSSISGSGNIKLSGTADYMKSSVAGSGTIKAYELKVNSIKASIVGSGDIRISVKNNLKATIAGSGSIYYKGNPPKIDTKSVGSGSVISRN